MKFYYFFFLLLISTLAIGQNSLTNTTWYLQYINANGTQFDNYFISNNEASEIQINFTETELSGNSTCNSYAGSYTIENTYDVKVNIGGVTLMGCQGILDYYELNYFSIVHNDFTYQISGTGDSQTLALTNTNGNYAVYGKTQPTVTLFKTWHLTSIETGAGNVSIPDTEALSLNLTTDFHNVIQRSLLNGFDGCNNFNGLYDMYVSNLNTFKMFQYNGDSGSCGNAYKDQYTSILSNTTTTFNYSISNEGKTLTLTNTAGEILVYSDKVLSIAENKFKSLNIYLAENPAIPI